MFREIKFDIIHRTGEKSWKRVAAVKIEYAQSEQGAAPQLFAVDAEGIIYKIDWENTYLLQYIGMLDKNGFPIYHGHVLQNAEGKNYEVFFGWGSFFIVESEESDRTFLTDALVSTMFVVGDVFQNPELALKPIDEEAFNKKVEENAKENDTATN